MVSKKTCKVCNILKDTTDFYKHRSNSDGLFGKCRQCISIYESKRKNKRKDNLLKNAYGISFDDFTKMRLIQNDKCAICFQTQERRALAVDHCHKTGKIRALLCDSCNMGLGKFQDSIDLLNRAIDYLSEKRKS